MFLLRNSAGFADLSYEILRNLRNFFGILETLAAFPFFTPSNSNEKCKYENQNMPLIALKTAETRDFVYIQLDPIGKRSLAY